MANVITVTALNRYVKTLLERDSVLTDVALRGEISNFTNHYKTGHFYFSLKDEQCSVKAVMFRRDAQNLAFMPQNGMRVIVRCRISLFERDGAFQVYVEDMFPTVLVQCRWHSSSRKSDKEGLFAPEHKKPPPAMPKCVGLVTSKTGAALQYILNDAKALSDCTFSLYSVTVRETRCPRSQTPYAAGQGRTCGRDHRCAGRRLTEDLWVFNTRVSLARHLPAVRP
ncbi:MAG: exodeoxyribonuclease VII large subunit [Ruthenibacterium lactatiformans]